MGIFAFYTDVKKRRGKMLRKLRLLSIVLVFSLLAGQLCAVNTKAAEGVSAPAAGTELSGLRITDLSKPVAGKMLDLTARVRTNQNVTWEIPVIWIDENGNTATIAEPGKTYYPNFVFYVPEGYLISEKQVNGQFSIKLPDFLISLFGNDSAVFVADAGKSITYITFLQALPEYRQSKAANLRPTDSTAVAAPSYVQPQVESAPEEKKSDDSHSLGSSSQSSSQGAPAGDDEAVDLVCIHCSQGAIDRLGRDVLEEIVTLVKNKLEPQAVNLLKNSFDAYSEVKAQDRALGQQIGLYVYYETGNIDDGTPEGDPAPDGALAYVTGGYMNDLDEDGHTVNIYKYVIGLNTKSFVTQDESGRWVINESENPNLDNTIVHELMHAFMDDYTRRGMNSSANENAFPGWFKEGIASTVENVYQYRAKLFQSLSVQTEGNSFNEDLDRYNSRVTYSDSSIRTKYVDANNELEGDYRYDLKWSGESDNTGSAYVSGYLAVVYLGYLAAVREGETNVITRTQNDANNENDVTINVNMDKIRKGESIILKYLHDGFSLDSIISYISSTGKDPDDPQKDLNPVYKDTNEFVQKFIQGTDEGSAAIRSTGNVSFMGSLAFCTNYLNYLEGLSDYGENTNYLNLANGSVLSNEQNYTSMLDHNREEASDYYQIIDSNKFVASTADDEKAWSYTGGVSESHFADDDANIISFPNDNEGAAAAARSDETSSVETQSGEPASDESTSDEIPSDETTVENHTESETAPSIDVVPETDDIPSTDMSGVEALPMPSPDAALLEGEVSESSGDDFCILPVEQDAIVPDEQVVAPIEETADPEPSGDGDEPSGDGGGDDSGSDDGSSDDSGSDGGCDEGGEG